MKKLGHDLEEMLQETVPDFGPLTVGLENKSRPDGMVCFYDALGVAVIFMNRKTYEGWRTHFGNLPDLSEQGLVSEK